MIEGSNFKLLWANIHVFILTAVSFFLLSNLSQILDEAFLLPVII